jgi:hypothetical protein
VAEVGGHRCPWQIGGCEFQIGHDGPHSWRQDGDVQTWHIPQSPKPPLLPDDDTAVNILGLAHCAVYHEHRLREDACADSLEEAGLLIAALRREVGD